MRVFAAGIATETNTFSPLPTGLEDFAVHRREDATPDQGAGSMANLPDVWGKQTRARGDDFIFSLMAWAQPSGTTLKIAYESLRDELLNDLRAAMPVDIVLLMLHGAMIAEGYDDCEKDLILRAREIAGLTAVIGVELDLHCHLSLAKIEAADIVLTYKEYPHVDINDRARQLFSLAVATKEGALRPTMALFDCRMIGVYPTTRQPLRGFVDAMSEYEQRPGIMAISFGHGYQFADLRHIGAKVLVVTDDNPGLARDVARQFGMQAYKLRRDIGFGSLSLSLEDALSKALESKEHPVVVADQSDNPGGGAPGDSTFALRWLIDNHAEDVAIAILHDPEVVRIAKKAKQGARLTVRLGGKLGPSSGHPVDIDVTVLSIAEKYLHEFPQQSGEPMLYPIGDVAALRCGTIDIIVGSERSQCFAPSIFSDLGIDLARKRLVIVKSTQHFYAAFAPIAGEVIYMAGPGAVAPDPRRNCYRQLDTSKMFPWSEDPLGE